MATRSSPDQSSSTGGKLQRPRAVALGLGAAGNDLVTHLMEADPRGVYCVAADTDEHSLHIAHAHSKLHLKQAPNNGTQDFDVGMKMGVNAFSTLAPILDATDIVFLLAGMGGACGGVAPRFSEVARRNGATVVGVLRKPFHLERSKIHTAIGIVRQMLNTCDTVILLDDHVSETSSVTLPFRLVADPTGEICWSLIDGITEAFNNDNASEAREVEQMLRRGGLARVGISHSYSDIGAEEAALKALRQALPTGDLVHARDALVTVTAGVHVPDGQFSSAIEILSQRINPKARLLHTRRVEPKLRGLTQVMLLATGVPFPYSWGGYREFPLDIYEIEPESGLEETISIDLELPQLEAISS